MCNKRRIEKYYLAAGMTRVGNRVSQQQMGESKLEAWNIGFIGTLAAGSISHGLMSY